MLFKKYIENRVELAKNYTNLLSGVPQDPKHHPEGDVFIHSKLVRKAIPNAIKELKNLQFDPDFSYALQNINFNCNEQELKILYLSAWLHDVGKYSATTIGGQNWQTAGAVGKIQAIGHQDSNHYLPQMEKLKEFAPQETIDLYLQNQELINFIIEHHMDFTNDVGFSKKFLADNFKDGMLNNDVKIKLLLILMWADKMGRKPEDTIALAIRKNADRLKSSINRSVVVNKPQKKPFEGTPEEFIKQLINNGVDKQNIINAVKAKFPNFDLRNLNEF